MNSNPIYSEILAVTTDSLERKVFECLAACPGKAVRREDLVRDLFGREVKRRELAADKHDRMIRQAISNLQMRGAPIVASARHSGYTLTDDQSMLEESIRELESRRVELDKKIHGLRRSQSLVRAIKQYPERATQPAMFNMAIFQRG